MEVIVVGRTPEAILVSDLLRKIGAYVLEFDGDVAPTDTIRPDVLVGSSEADSFAFERAQSAVKAQIVCDLVGGADGASEGGVLLNEYDLQAVTGLVDTTGFPEEDWVRSKAPFIAVSTALYAVSAIFAAFIGKQGGTIKVSRYLTAVSSLTTFLPSALLDGAPSRIGNAHPASSPWNAYPTSDGWILICTSKDEQWRRICKIANSTELSSDALAVQSDRVARRSEVDEQLSRWTRTLRTEDCARALLEVGVPVGPILELADLRTEANVRLRQPSYVAAAEREGDLGQLYPHISLFEEERISSSGHGVSRQHSGQATSTRPLAGLKVIEIGQFTAVPLAGRHLAHLGADVLKIEPPAGEPARTWAPLLDGLSHYYTISNSGKKVEKIDLKGKQQRAWLLEQLQTADLLIENMRPGVLRKLGFVPEDLIKANPGLVVTSVSGFGAKSAYPGRAAFDTVIQGMSGVMDVTQSEGRPVKFGISVADILGAQVALFASLVALYRGGGRFIDVAMQDISVYLSVLANADIAQPYTDTPVKTVAELAANKAFRDRCLTTIPDENGAMRHASKMPYSFEPAVYG